VQHWLLGPQVWPPLQQMLPQHWEPEEQMVPPQEKEPDDAHTLLMQLPAQKHRTQQQQQQQRKEELWLASNVTSHTFGVGICSAITETQQQQQQQQQGEIILQRLAAGRRYPAACQGALQVALHIL
jgi:hypothetical protein